MNTQEGVYKTEPQSVITYNIVHVIIESNTYMYMYMCSLISISVITDYMYMYIPCFRKFSTKIIFQKINFQINFQIFKQARDTLNLNI